MRNAAQSGQATTEMAFMLLGFAVLLLGLICTMSLEIFNTRVLLDAKYRTEQSVNAPNAAQYGGAGKELRGWDYEQDIPFTLKDTPLLGLSTAMSEAGSHLGDRSRSNAPKYLYDYLPLRDFPAGSFKADFKDRHSTALAAANLITREGEPDVQKSLTFTALLPEFYTFISNFLGVKVDYQKLQNNPSNRVFLPANGEL